MTSDRMTIIEGPSECDECFHPIEKHGPDGCTVERTRDIEGSSETESGPCGCQAWEHEVLSEAEFAAEKGKTI